MMKSKAKSEKQRRWYEKLKADPVRLAAFRERTRKAALAYYHGAETNPQRKENIRARRRETAKRQWQTRKHDPRFLARRRAASNKRCTELQDKYIAERLRIDADQCPKSLIELKRAHLQLQRQLRTQKP